MTQGILYGIGVGPGDPDFITLKAVRVLSTVDMVFAASAVKNSQSLAAEIAKPHLRASVPIQILPFPMTRNKQAKEAAWQDNARTVIKVLEQGKNVAFITLGDCMTYSTYGYLLKHIVITSYSIHYTKLYENRRRRHKYYRAKKTGCSPSSHKRLEGLFGFWGVLYARNNFV